MNLTTIIEMGRAWFRAYTGPSGNETALDGKPNTNDPVKHRMGTFDVRSYFGALSGDLLKGNSADPIRYEKVLVSFRPDDNHQQSQQDGKPGGCVEVYCQTPYREDDGGMVRALSITSDRIEMFGHVVANYAGLLPGGSAGGPMVFSPDGTVFLNVQDDANIVCYKMENGVPKAMFDTMSLLARLDALEAKVK